MIQPLAIPEVLLIQPTIFCDTRGSFFESFNARNFQAATGFEGEFVQDNQSLSREGVVRGLHYQVGRPQGKLVRVINGAIWDVAVDLRRSSPTFGRWVSQFLAPMNRPQLWIPPGFAHGFMTLAPDTEVLYKTTDYWCPDQERCIRWDDPTLAIKWPDVVPHVSTKDAAGVLFAEAECYE